MRSIRPDTHEIFQMFGLLCKSVLIYIVYFVIRVGEITQFVFIAPFYLILFFYSQIRKIRTHCIRKNTSSSEILYQQDETYITFRPDTQIILSSLMNAVHRYRIALHFTLPAMRFDHFKKKSYVQYRLPLTFSWSARIRNQLNKLFFRSPKILRRTIWNSNIKSFIAGFCLCLILVSSFQTYVYIRALPDPRSIGTVNFAQSSHMYDRNGILLYEVYRDVSRTPVRLSAVPVRVIQATISIEDKHFYQHKGVSFFGGIIRAAKDTLQTRELQGGSTITQQLIKTALLTPERTIDRKIKEILLALWAEHMYSKNQILEMYLNQVAYGGSAYGIEEAAETYFGIHASQLNLPQAALLAGLPKAPSIYSPYASTTKAITRRNEVLNEMLRDGVISRLEHDVAIASPLSVKPVRSPIKAPHFVFFVKSDLEKEYGMRLIEEGGLNVKTTLDYRIQQYAENVLSEELAKIQDLNVQNGGIVVLDAHTGELLAMVGSKGYFSGEDGAFNVTTALRQPGSTFKPVLYSLALQKGFTASSMLDDSPIVFQTEGSPAYVPVNYDGRFHGKVPLRFALANSYNIPAIKVLNTIGVDEFVSHAQRMGVTSWNERSRYGLSIALGGAEVSLLNLAQVFDVFANGGYRQDIQTIRTVKDNRGTQLQIPFQSRNKVLDEGIAFIISDILADHDARVQAFGPNSALEIPEHRVSVKTGTSNDKRDNLTVGYNQDFLVAVWVGNNDSSPMNPYLTSGITGAAPIWNRVMTYLISTFPSRYPPMHRPTDVVAVACYPGGKEEFFLIGTQKNSGCIGGDLYPKPDQTAQNTQ